MQTCPLCQERPASPKYYRLHGVTEEVEHICQVCWLSPRKGDRDEWKYFQGVGRLFLLYTVVPFLALAALLLFLWAVL